MNIGSATAAVLVAVSMIAMSPSAGGAVVTYTDRGLFDLAAASHGTQTMEGYESYSVQTGPGPGTISLDYFDISYDLLGDISAYGIDNNNNSNVAGGIYSTSGTQFFRADYPTAAGPPTATTTFHFASPIMAFATDLRDVENVLNFALSSGESGIAGFIVPSGDTQFFGVISDDQPFTWINFTQSRGGGGDTVVFDQTSFIPAPAGTALFGICASIISTRRRR